jgi:uncharacterized membrane protein YgcG
MLIRNLPRSVLVVISLALAAPLAGCEMEEAEVPVAGAGYEPTYYDGYMVYYDGAGLPYYYMDDTMYYVPRSYAYYDSLCDHYQVYRPYYHRWYVSGGYRYRGYRSSAPDRMASSSRVYRPASPGPHVHAPRSVPHGGGGGPRGGGFHRSGGGGHRGGGGFHGGGGHHR